MSATESTIRGATRSAGPSAVFRRVGVAVAATGLVLVIAGTFAPWVSSGGILRNSYAVVGIARRLGYAGSGVGAVALPWWPLIGPVAMAVFVMGILRWWRTAGTAAVLFGLTTGLVGTLALALAGGHELAGVALAYPGPVLVVVGAAACVSGGGLVLAGCRRSTPAAVMWVSLPISPDVSATANIGPSGPNIDDEGIRPR